MIAGIIVAAGAGKRLGADQNKALLPLGGQALFCYGVRALRAQCGFLALVTRPEERAQFEEALRRAGLRVDAIVPGGRERRHSVENALSALPEEASIVLVHDAARPFTSQRLIGQVIHAARQTGAAIPALAVSDTLRQQQPDGSTRTVPREGLYRVQTPQGFQKKLLLDAYAATQDALTDDAGLVERLGHPIALVAGEAINFKITTPGDWEMAGEIAKSK